MGLFLLPAFEKLGIFTKEALDNLDHYPSSTTSTSSFHGTGISLFQLPTEGYAVDKIEQPSYHSLSQRLQLKTEKVSQVVPGEIL